MLRLPGLQGGPPQVCLLTGHLGRLASEAIQQMFLEDKEVETGRIPFKFYLQGAVRLANPFPALLSATWSTPVGEGWGSPGEEERLDGDCWQNSLDPHLLVL